MKRIGVALLILLGLSCGATAGSSAEFCGFSPDDWCAGPEGDPCAGHTDAASCRADDRCFGMPYRGESVIACILDERGFASNCPTVGCTSTPPAKPSKAK